MANLVGDCVLMFGFGWGVAGAALATSFSQYCSLGILLAMGIRKGMLKFSDLRYPPDPRDIGALLRVRIPLRSCCESRQILLVQHIPDGVLHHLLDRLCLSRCWKLAWAA